MIIFNRKNKDLIEKIKKYHYLISLYNNHSYTKRNLYVVYVMIYIGILIFVAYTHYLFANIKKNYIYLKITKKKIYLCILLAEKCFQYSQTKFTLFSFFGKMVYILITSSNTLINYCVIFARGRITQSNPQCENISR